MRGKGGDSHREEAHTQDRRQCGPRCNRRARSQRERGGRRPSRSMIEVMPATVAAIALPATARCATRSPPPTQQQPRPSHRSDRLRLQRHRCDHAQRHPASNDRRTALHPRSGRGDADGRCRQRFEDPHRVRLWPGRDRIGPDPDRRQRRPTLRGRDRRHQHRLDDPKLDDLGQLRRERRRHWHSPRLSTRWWVDRDREFDDRGQLGDE